MPIGRGKVHDDGDPGNMNGERIGLIRPNGNPHEVQLIPFKNSMPYFKKGKKVEYETKSEGNWMIAYGLKDIKEEKELLK